MSRKSIPVLMVLAALCAAPANDPFTRFAHPVDGDTIRRGQTVRVVAAAMNSEPPADGVLQSSENSGVTWQTLPDSQINGRSITGVYFPTAGQASVVKFRTVSPSAPWFHSQISVFVSD